MRVLHTADWHLGQRLHGQERTAEHRHFLFQQLLPLLSDERVDALVLAGDVFDTGAPSTTALGLYYEFLAAVARHTPCRQVVVVGGNHDSAATLHAPDPVLRQLGVRVVGDVPEAFEDQVFTLNDPRGRPRLAVAAVPFVRERHLGLRLAGCDQTEIQAQIRDGMAGHYARVAELARAHHAAGLPVLATGHLFASGLSRSEGMRDIHVGNLGQISADCFSDVFDYVALGHIHRPQRVGGQNRIRYSGSPVALAFDETDLRRRVLLLEFGNCPGCPDIQEIELAHTRLLRRERGTPQELAEALRAYQRPETELPTWFSLELTGWGNLTPMAADALVREAAHGRDPDLLVLHLQKPRLEQAASLAAVAAQGRHLHEMSVEEVFSELLHQKDLNAETQAELRQTFRQLLSWQQEQQTAGVRLSASLPLG